MRVFLRRTDVFSAALPLIFHFAFLNSRLHSNNLHCDCHLAWLAQWLRQRPTVGLFTQCTLPAELRGLNVAEVQKHEFSCSGKSCIYSFTCPVIRLKQAFILTVLLLCLATTWQLLCPWAFPRHFSGPFMFLQLSWVGSGRAHSQAPQTPPPLFAAPHLPAQGLWWLWTSCFFFSSRLRNWCT